MSDATLTSSAPTQTLGIGSRHFRVANSMLEKSKAMELYAKGTVPPPDKEMEATAHAGQTSGSTRPRSPSDNERPDSSKKPRTEPGSDAPLCSASSLAALVPIQVQPHSKNKQLSSSKKKSFAYASEDMNDGPPPQIASSPTLVSSSSSSVIPHAPPVPPVPPSSRVIPHAPPVPPVSPSSRAQPTTAADVPVPCVSLSMSPDQVAAAHQLAERAVAAMNVYVTHTDLKNTIAPIHQHMEKMEAMLVMIGAQIASSSQPQPSFATPSSTPSRSDSPTTFSFESASHPRTPSSHDHRVQRTHLPPLMAAAGAGAYARLPSSGHSFPSSPPAHYASTPHSSSIASSPLLHDGEAVSSSPTSSSASTISTFSKPANPKLRERYADWKKSSCNSDACATLDSLVSQKWRIVAADEEKAQWLSFDGKVSDADSNKRFVDEVVASIGDLSSINVEPGFIHHAVQEKWRRIKKTAKYKALPEEEKQPVRKESRKKQRKQTRLENRKRVLQSQLFDFRATHYAAKNAIPGPEQNYFDLEKVMECEEMHSDCESDDDMVKGVLKEVIYKNGVPHRSQLCEDWIRLLDKSSRGTKHQRPVGSDPVKALEAKKRCRNIDAKELFFKGIPARMLNGVVIPDATSASNAAAAAVPPPAATSVPAGAASAANANAAAATTTTAAPLASPQPAAGQSSSAAASTSTSTSTSTSSTANRSNKKTKSRARAKNTGGLIY